MESTKATVVKVSGKLFEDGFGGKIETLEVIEDFDLLNWVISGKKDQIYFSDIHPYEEDQRHLNVWEPSFSKDGVRSGDSAAWVFINEGVPKWVFSAMKADTLYVGWC